MNTIEIAAWTYSAVCYPCGFQADARKEAIPMKNHSPRRRGSNFSRQPGTPRGRRDSGIHPHVRFMTAGRATAAISTLTRPAPIRGSRLHRAPQDFDCAGPIGSSRRAAVRGLLRTKWIGNKGWPPLASTGGRYRAGGPLVWHAT